MSSTRRLVDLADGAMLLTVLVWGANNVLTKSALDEFAPLTFVFCRFLIVVVVLFGVLRLRGADLRRPRSDLRLFLLSGISGYAAYNALFTVGLKHTSSFSTAVLLSTGPIFTLLLAALCRLESIRWQQTIGMLCAFAGVVLFVWEKLAAGRPALGDGLSLLGAITFSVYSLVTVPLTRRYPPATATAWSALIGLIAIMPFALPSVAGQSWHLSFEAWAGLFYSSLISMLVAYTLWAWAIERRGVARTVPFLYLVPVSTGFFAVIVLHEQMTVEKIAGAALVLGGIALMRLLGRRAGGVAMVPEVVAVEQIAAGEDVASVVETVAVEERAASSSPSQPAAP